MSETAKAPERIWAWDEVFGTHRVWTSEETPALDGAWSGDQYIRADLVQAKDAEIARLRAQVAALIDTAQEPVAWLPTETVKWLLEYDGPACATRTAAWTRPIRIDGGVPVYLAPKKTGGDAQMRAEGRVAGLREAAEIAGLNAWKHAGEDDYSRGMDAGAAHQVRACCDAIRAHADKIEGDTVKARDEAIRGALSARGDDGRAGESND